MYKLKVTKRFRKDLKKISNDKKLLEELTILIDLLKSDIKLDIKYQNHNLKGEFQGQAECHLRPDVLLIYKKEKEYLILKLLRLGNHNELFN